MRTIVVGAGLSGLITALKLSDSRDVVVFDKARGVGGRLATRRTDQSKFDHGAQFYRLKEPLRDLHERWLGRGLVKLWFAENRIEHFCAIEGMTALAKDLAREVAVTLNERVSSLKREGEEWVVTFESGLEERANEVVFTSPVPQTLEILKKTGIAYPSALDGVTYSKALVVLIEKSPRPFRFPAEGYLEPERSSIFSVANQSDKGLTKNDALTVTLGAETSETLFESSDDEVLRFATEQLRKLSPDFGPGDGQVKRWRYGQVQEPFGALFAEPQQGLYLIGDGFGGASLNGAARSADALVDHLVRHVRGS